MYFIPFTFQLFKAVEMSATAEGDINLIFFIEEKNVIF